MEYKDGYRAVDGVTFRVERGQVVGLLGPNGAGKTTTLRVLMGLIAPTKGSIQVFGETIIPGASVLARVGAFIEGPGFLPHLSGRDNLRLYWAATGRPIDDADFETALDIAGLGASLDRRVKSYSHGMKQRLAIAQAMLGLPELLVLDEPTNGLDPPQIAEMREVLQRYAETGTDGSRVEHLLAEVEQTCTHVVVMHKGRLVAAGSVLEIAGSGGRQLVVDDPDRAAQCWPRPASTRTPCRPGGRWKTCSSIWWVANDLVGPEMSEQTIAATRRGVHERLGQLGPVHGSAFDPRKTLKLRVEFVRQLKRRRTQLSVALLLALPIIIAIAFKVGGAPKGGENRSALVSIATVGGANFALFTEFASVGFLLVVIVALYCGDTVASEASWASLRYLLAMPVRRARLLRQKLIVALAFSFVANLILPVWSFLVGGVVFGWAPARSPVAGTFDLGTTIQRLGIVIAYCALQSLVVAGLAFMLSVLTDAPLGAVGGAVLLVVVSNILDQITALDPYRQYLPMHFQFSWLDALGPSVVWDDMLRGTGLVLVYAAVFFGIAWWRFDRKDITS